MKHAAQTGDRGIYIYIYMRGWHYILKSRMRCVQHVAQTVDIYVHKTFWF